MSVTEQYRNDGNLNTRISIHDRYSTNRLGFGNWIMSNYAIIPGSKILELGCGTGYMWKNKLDLLEGGSSLVLTDLSEGMLESAGNNLGASERVSFRRMDIQDIAFPSDSFDILIANMMLYHVPDIHQGLSEVRRVLRAGGTFYCATYGEHGIMEFITEILRELNVSGSIGTSFTLQNGKETLSRHFEQVIRLDYPDSLAVTNLDDFADYIYSLSSLSGTGKLDRRKLISVLETHTENGILTVPKEYGMFICR